ncbi:Inositol 2-dehydrogenase/D-chiro-inositol 3-dehydrogenase [Neolewinella maritima]|uniref:Inositol 2-dehydrogenase/D-chiro-inositol 3-dehydrogenase n=1 Tax=Neolewinella maritima TaxID=1383882 RepID=A0ABM9AYV8_9BACT|nr:Gfo/Idh/MocA family oxidoreductase [Neolewinella maritima]CAH0999661.1 Inositol 2-dehydrogenase/D-chiro-inositol 3-dehydrogenase [Neolewinella maritima]
MDSPQLPIRFAVIGVGHIGRRHASLIAAHPEAQLVALCDPLGKTEIQWPEGVDESIACYKRLDELLSRQAFDVAVVCTPNGLHASQGLQCLRAGRNVVIEKPMALRTQDCDALIALARQRQLHVFGVMQNRYSPAAAWLKELVAGQHVGQILQVHLDCFWNRDDRYYRLADGSPHAWHGDATLDGGVLYTQFAHFIDLLCWTFGDIQVLHAQFANQTHTAIHDFADTGMVHFSLPNGGLGSLTFSTAIWDRNFESTLTAIGTRGTVKLGGQYMNELQYCHVEGLLAPALPPSAPPNNYGPYQGSAANHHFVIDNVVDVLRGRAPVATTAEEGRAVVKVIEDIYRVSGVQEPGRTS